MNNDIVRGLRRRLPGADAVRAQDVGLSGVDDTALLEWAALHDRVVVTHDVTTLTHFAYERIRRGERMPGVFEVSPYVPVGRAIDDLELIIECSQQGEWEGQVRYLPL